MRKRSESREDSRRRLSGIEAAAKAFDDFRPARDVLSVVRAVPTQFIQFDHASKVNGLPIERFMLMHGPSGEGKTFLSLGFLASFLARDHFAMLVDAERTTPITWARSVMGRYADHPGFFAMRPSTYEETVDTVRRFLLRVKEQRDKGNVSPDTSALIIVDSLKKLMPERIWDKIKKDVEKNGVDGVGGAAGRLKAAMNAQWMNELTPLLEDCKAGFIAIAREREDPDADMWAKKAGTDYTVGGGKDIYYDSSLVMRVERASWVQDGGDDDGKNKSVFGEKHLVTIRKTKIGVQDHKSTLCYFHTSNGKLVPEGFDRARDIVELGIKFELVDKAGAWLSFHGQRLGQGIHNTVKALHENSGLLEDIEREVRESFKKHEPTEVSADGEVA